MHVHAYPNYICNSCATALAAGNSYMGSLSQTSSSKTVVVKRGATVLSSGDPYTAGETLSVSISSSSDVAISAVIEVSSGTISGGSTCDSRRSCDSGTGGSDTWTLPTTGTASIKMAWASGYGTVYITNSFTLELAAPPTAAPTTAAPTVVPTPVPTALPTEVPSESPTEVPTVNNAPTLAPATASPTEVPTLAPTEEPTTATPTESPTTAVPTESPTAAPTASPTLAPTTAAPSEAPTLQSSSFAVVMGMSVQGLNAEQAEDNRHIKCEAGMYIKNKCKGHDVESCEKCQAGKFNNRANNENKRCKKCPVNSYQNEKGATECKKCPPGFHSRNSRGKKQCFEESSGKSMKKLGYFDQA